MKVHLRILLIFTLISAAIIFSWFREGLLYGGGDVGLQTYNPQRILENAKYVWWEAAGPGASLPQGLSAIPFQFGLYILQLIGLSPVGMQAALFFLLMTLMGFGMYLFIANSFASIKKYAFLGGLFYMLNPYMMIQVWHRFIHTTIVLAAALPFFGIFWNKWIKEGSARHFFLFLLTTAFSFYAFGTYAFILAVWIFLTLLTIAAILPWQGKKHSLGICIRFVFAFVVWVLINAWWLIPVSQISPAVLSEQHKTEESLMTLLTISNQEILPYSLQLINPFYLVNQADFGTVYKNFFMLILPWIFVFLILLGVINSLKQKQFSLYGIFYMLALFLAKGAASPFGSLYVFGFSNIFALGVLRNPFEKTGLILVFFSTVMLVLGLKFLTEKLKNPSLEKLAPFGLIGIILIFSWPMFFGKVIGRYDKPAYVQVPQSYKDADTWFKEKKASGTLDGKILHLPLTQKESIEYKWTYGYSGLEPSDTFFTAYPSISRGFNIERIDNALAFLGRNIENPEELGDFNVRFIVLHKDTQSSRDFESILNKLTFLTRQQQFGDLIIYQIKDEYFKPKITFENNFSLLYAQGNKLSDLKAFIREEGIKTVSPSTNESTQLEQARERIIFPKNSFIYGLASGSADLMDAYVARFESMKPILKQTGMIQSLDLADAIIKLSRIPPSDKEYEQILNKIFPQGIEINRFEVNGQESLLSSLFRIHLSNLTDPALREKLNTHLINLNLKPEFFDDGKQERKVFKFNIPADDDYEILMTNPDSAEFFEGNLKKLTFYINNKEEMLISETQGKLLNFGKTPLLEGNLEISYPVILSSSIASREEAKAGYLEIPIEKITGSQNLRFSADVKMEQGTGFYVLFYENENTQPSIKEYLQASPSLVFQKLQMNIQTQKEATKGKIIILMVSADGTSPSKALFNNIKVQKLLSNDIILRSKKENILSQSQAETSFKRLSPIKYEGKVKSTGPGFLFFRETFHPGWKLTLKDADGLNDKKQFIGSLYANAWYIDTPGDYEFEITFEPQNKVYLGLGLSLFGLIMAAAYAIFFKRMKI